jgi:hypothetical protein
MRPANYHLDDSRLDSFKNVDCLLMGDTVERLVVNRENQIAWKKGSSADN